MNIASCVLVRATIYGALLLLKIRRLQTTTTSDGRRMAEVDRRTVDGQWCVEGHALSVTWRAADRSTPGDGSPTCRRWNWTPATGGKAGEVGGRRAEALVAVVSLTTRQELCQHDL